MRRFCALLAAAVLLGACGPNLVRTDVTRFHNLSPAPPPRTFAVLPQPDQVGSLEFGRYADLVAAGLQAQGWQPVAADGNPEALVSLDWGVGPPETEFWRGPSTSLHTGFGWGRRSHRYGLGVGFPLTDPFYYETRAVTEYPKWLELEIVDAEAQRAGERRVIFEGRATSEGRRRDIAPVMPYLVRALFTGFPGASGQTVPVGVPVDQ